MMVSEYRALYFAYRPEWVLWPRTGELVITRPNRTGTLLVGERDLHRNTWRYRKVYRVKFKCEQDYRETITTTHICAEYPSIWTVELEVDRFHPSFSLWETYEAVYDYQREDRAIGTMHAASPERMCRANYFRCRLTSVNSRG